MEQKIKIPKFKKDDDAMIENTKPKVLTLSLNEELEDWEKISEDWVSLYLDPIILDDHSRSSSLDLEDYSQFDSTLPKKNDQFFSQDLPTNSFLLHSTNSQLSHSDMKLGSSSNVVKDLFEKDNHFHQVGSIHSKRKPFEHNNTISVANNLIHINENPNSRMEVDLWNDKEINLELSILLKQEINAKVSSNVESSTSPLTISNKYEFWNNASSSRNLLESSSCLLQCEEGEIRFRKDEHEDSSSSNSSSIVQLETPSTTSHFNTIGIRHLQTSCNAIKVSLLRRFGDNGSSVEDRKNCEEKSFKLQDMEALQKVQQSYCRNSNNEGINENDEKQKIPLLCNQESVQLSKQKKKVYIGELECELRTMVAIVVELNTTINYLTKENVNLRRQLGYCYPISGINLSFLFAMIIYTLKNNY